MYRIHDDKRALYSRELIFAGLSRLAREKPYHKITVTELARVSNVGRATFYRCFESIDEVLHWKCDQILSGMPPFFGSVMKHETDLAMARTEFLRTFLDYWDSHADLIELLLQANRMDVLHNSFRQLIRRIAAEQHPLPTSMVTYFDYFLAVWQGVLINIVVEWIRNQRQPSSRLVADLIVQQLLRQPLIEWLFSPFSNP